MNDLQEQVKVEHVPAEKNEQGVAVSIKAHEILNLNQSYNRYLLAEHWDVAQRWNFPAPRLPLHQVHRYLSQARAMLRLDRTPAEENFHQTCARVYNLPHLRDEERPLPVQPKTKVHLRSSRPTFVRLEVRPLHNWNPSTSLFPGGR